MASAQSSAPHDARSNAEIGRRARLELCFACRAGRTVLVHAYAEPPFRVGHCFEDGDGGAHLVLASSAPGIFPGDRFHQSVVVEPEARVRLVSQSSLQVHPGVGDDEARIESAYHVHAGASLSCEWHPTIPFSSSRLSQRIRIEIEGDGRLRWSDAMMSGREARGERWQFSRLAHELSLRHDQTLQYLERYVIAPACNPPDRRWAGHDANYFGTMLTRGWHHDRAAVDRLQAALAQYHEVEGAADLLMDDVALVRLMAGRGASFHALRQSMTALLTR